MSAESKAAPFNFKSSFAKSLVTWGGWRKLVSNSGEDFVEAVSQTIQRIALSHRKDPARIGKLTPEEWNPLVETFEVFLNAYLQQELDDLLDGPRDLMTVMRMVDDNLTGQMLMAVVLAARELHFDVEVSCKDPHGVWQKKHVCSFANRGRLATLSIEVGVDYAEEHLPLVLHAHGEEMVWDKDESTPKNPVWVPIPVDRKGVIFLDGRHSETLHQRRQEEFLKTQGFQTARYSAEQLQHDLFSCAAEAVKFITGRELPPPSQQ